MLFSFDSVPVKILGAFDLTRQKGYIYTHRNSYYAISIRVCGSTEFFIDNDTIITTIGDIIVIPPNLVYSQYTEGERILAIHFDCLKDFNIKTIQKHKVKNWDDVRNIFKKIYDCYSKKPQGWYYKSSALLYELLYLLHNESESKKPNQPDNIDIAMNFLEAHFTDRSITISDIAKISGYSEAYFRRLFFNRFGVTPIEHLKNLRIEMAKRLLESKKHTMQEIAEEVGIIDPKYFSTWFKKYIGVSPREYLSQIGG